MGSKQYWVSTFLFLGLALFLSLSPSLPNYPNLKKNPYLKKGLQTLIVPYLLPLNHPTQPALKEIFSVSRVTENEETLLAAGFEILSRETGSFVVVARHPKVPGYIFKLYYDSEMRYRIKRGKKTNCESLVYRCISAEQIKKLIRSRKFSHFTVPDKWIYILPLVPTSKSPNQQPILLLETDMQLVDEKETLIAWKTKAKKEHLNELYQILKRGYGSTALSINVPYTKNGTFAFIDTENPKSCNLKSSRKYFSEEMQLYWKTLIE